jgi:putative nucleotidyltransferase with HDIG domain
MARAWLGEELVSLFIQQNAADQRHALDAAAFVNAAAPHDRELRIAALMHDVGKRHARLGVLGRVGVSVAIKTGLPLKPRGQDYRDHGAIGAAELAAIGAPGIAVDFARSHHEERPDWIGAPAWELLVAADQPPKTWVTIRRWITSTIR